MVDDLEKKVSKTYFGAASLVIVGGAIAGGIIGAITSQVLSKDLANLAYDLNIQCSEKDVSKGLIYGGTFFGAISSAIASYGFNKKK